MFVEIRLYNLMTYVFKGHVKFVKIYMVKFNVSFLLILSVSCLNERMSRQIGKA